ncbi:MAG: hypothetical protein Kow0031_27120 [Anaerolineae bacterium]
MKLAQNLLLALLGLVVALALLELAARLLPPPFDSSQTNPAETCWPVTGWRGKPNFETTIATGNVVHNLKLNSRGMHDTEHPTAKPPNTYRILLLGDSFVHAIQVPEADTAHQVLEQRLNQHDDLPAVQVISGGVSGWGTGQQLGYYQAEGRSYQPDLVLLMLYLGNDVKDNLPGRGITVEGKNCYTPYFTLAGNRLDPTPWRYAPGLPPALGQGSWLHKQAANLLGWLHQHSALYTQLEPLLAPEPIQASMLDFYIGNNPTFDYALELTYQLVDELRRQVALDGAQFGVVLISPKSLVEFSLMDAAAREEVYARLPAMRAAELMPPPNQTLAARLSADGSPSLDLLPAFVAHLAAGGEPLFFEQDQHWTSAGNRLAADTMYQWLIENRVITHSQSE